MIGGKPPNPHFNSLFLNQSCIKLVVGDSVGLPKIHMTYLLKLVVSKECTSFGNENTARNKILKE